VFLLVLMWRKKFNMVYGLKGNLRETFKKRHTNFVTLKNLKETLEKHHTNFVTLKNLKETSEKHHTNFVILKNLKGGFM